MKLLTHRTTEVITTYSRSFARVGDAGSGYIFDCDKEGNPTGLHPIGAANFKKLLTGTLDGAAYTDEGVVARERHYTHPATGECECGEVVTLANFTNTCECGADYNKSGSRLAPREQWGSETGERWTECY